MDSETLMLVGTVVVFLLIGVAVWAYASRRRRVNLRERFGPEYERTVEAVGQTRAEAVLRERADRVSRFNLRKLTQDQADAFAREWRRIQARFVDDPEGAVGALPVDVDASPCHGRAGLAEMLLYATDVLDDQQYADQVVKMWKRTVRMHGGRAQWPSGVASGRSNPSLMLGDAGVGYALLRAHDPSSVPPILIIETTDGESVVAARLGGSTAIASRGAK